MARRPTDRTTVPRDPVARQKATPSSHERAQCVAIQSVDLRKRRIEDVVRTGRHSERRGSFRWRTEP